MAEFGTSTEATGPIGPIGPVEPSQRGKVMLVAVSVAVLVASILGAAVLFWPDAKSRQAANAGAGADERLSAADPGASSAIAAGGSPSAAPSATGAARTASATPNSGATYADEFSGTAVDSARWKVYTATAPNGSLWKPAAVTVGGGELRIAGTGRNSSGAGNVSGGVCWCGPEGLQQYGTWQVRARFDAGAGYGPVIGLWPDSGSPTADGYLSFVRIPRADRRTLNAVLAWPGAGKATPSMAGDFTAWHVYSVQWRPNSLKVLVDDKVLYDSTGKPGVVLPKKPMHLIVQQMVGPVDDVPAAGAATPDQVAMHIDWVRYFR